jgi:UTP--glucose-1-phosphate uridylyltransferase
MYAFNFFGRRYDLGDKEGFLEATVEFALRKPELRDVFKNHLDNLKK